MLPEINLGNIYVSSYWILAFAGAFVAFSFLFYLNSHFGEQRLTRIDLINMILIGVVCAFLGGRLLGILVKLPITLGRLKEEAGIWDKLKILFTSGGIVYYGGMLGLLAGICVYCIHYQINGKTVAVYAAHVIPLFHSIARIGCFLAGCCYGVPAGWGFAMVNHQPEVLRVPVQLIESVFNFVLFLLITICTRILPKEKKWLVLPGYLFAYSTGRFLLEFWRGDIVRGIWILSTSQWISLGIWVGLAVFFLWKAISAKNRR